MSIFLWKLYNSINDKSIKPGRLRSTETSCFGFHIINQANHKLIRQIFDTYFSRVTTSFAWGLYHPILVKPTPMIVNVASYQTAILFPTVTTHNRENFIFADYLPFSHHQIQDAVNYKERVLVLTNWRQYLREFALKQPNSLVRLILAWLT